MTRKELYDQITSLKLQDEVRACFGKNYTNCSNIQLETLITEVITSMATKGCGADCALTKLVNILEKKRILLKSEVKEILY